MTARALYDVPEKSQAIRGCVQDPLKLKLIEIQSMTMSPQVIRHIPVGLQGSALRVVFRSQKMDGAPLVFCGFTH